MLLIVCTGEAAPQVLYPVSRSSLKRNLEMVKSLQRRSMKLVKGLDSKAYEDWLNKLELFSLENRRLMGDRNYSLLKRRL